MLLGDGVANLLAYRRVGVGIEVDVVSSGIDRRQHSEQRLTAVQLPLFRLLLGLQHRGADQSGEEGGECEQANQSWFYCKSFATLKAMEAPFRWKQRERTRAEILAAVDEAEVSLARGEGRPITEESMRQLANRQLSR